MRISRFRATIAVLSATIASPVAMASGFAFYEHGAKASGQAGAWVARADDAAANWYNPAALVRLEGGEVQFGGNWVELGSDIQFTLNDNSAVGVSNLLGFPVANGQRFEMVSNTATPVHFYWSQKAGDKVAFGVGINNPFGLITEWDQAPLVFSARRSELRTYLVNPNLSIAVNESWSVGLGLDYLSAEVRSFSRDAIFDLAPPLGVPDTVATANLTGEGDALGYNLGFLFRTKHVSVAGNYRSEMAPEITGKIQFAGPLGNVLNSSAATKPRLPAQTFLGIAFTSDRFDIEIGGNHAAWNSFKSLDIQTPNPATTQSVTENWSEAWAYRLGAAFRLGAKMSHEIRLGGVLDESPIPSDFLRPSIPDSDRIGYTIGYGYSAKCWGFDAYAMQIDWDDVTATGAFADGVIKGTYESSALLLGLTGRIRY